MTWESFLALKDRLIILTFDPTDEATPAPLEADLRGVTFAVAGIIAAIGLVALLLRWLGARHHENKESPAG
ncbi:MAG: hypothetical protein IMW89_11135 [Ktedonobacteraceae bacterium]|nr:hypothetical protein [Ktedonobacteraceae bacterium]